MRKLLLLGCAVLGSSLVLVRTVSAEGPPKDVKGWQAAQFGMSEDEVLRAYPTAKRVKKPNTTPSGMTFSVEIGDIVVDGRSYRVSFGFEQSRLVRVILDAKHKFAFWEDYQALEKALNSEFGPPNDIEDNSPGSKSGRFFLHWNLPNSFVRLLFAGYREPGRKQQYGTLVLYYDQKSAATQ